VRGGRRRARAGSVRVLEALAALAADAALVRRLPGLEPEQ
jgi:hypothetical protein